MSVGSAQSSARPCGWEPSASGLQGPPRSGPDPHLLLSPAISPGSPSSTPAAAQSGAAARSSAPDGLPWKSLIADALPASRAPSDRFAVTVFSQDTWATSLPIMMTRVASGPLRHGPMSRDLSRGSDTSLTKPEVTSHSSVFEPIAVVRRDSWHARLPRRPPRSVIRQRRRHRRRPGCARSSPVCQGKTP